MARPRVRRKTKNPSTKTTRRVAKTHSRRKPLPIPAGKTIVENWDKTKTLQQNYERLGLLMNINGNAGGSESQPLSKEEQAEAQLQELIDTGVLSWQYLDPEKAQQEEKEKIIELDEPQLPVPPGAVKLGQVPGLTKKLGLHPENQNKSLAVKIIAALEEAASNAYKKPRWVSDNETKTLHDLMKKYGDDYTAMGK